jgi:steroid 5-alpha reductase family enzyme
VRLGFFLFRRILIRGSDFRFDKLVKGNHGYNLFCWCSQATWIWLQGFCIWSLNTASAGGSTARPLGLLDLAGFAIAAHGLLIEHMADVQKSTHNKKIPSGGHKGWLAKGLWSISRHPNYFGEHLVWVGLAVICAAAQPTNLSYAAACLVSPLWSVFFLVHTSLMLLEKRMDRDFESKKTDKKVKRNYADYKATVPLLIPEVAPYPFLFKYDLTKK